MRLNAENGMVLNEHHQNIYGLMQKGDYVDLLALFDVLADATRAAVEEGILTNSWR
jgi:hypothetical protein